MLSIGPSFRSVVQIKWDHLLRSLLMLLRLLWQILLMPGQESERVPEMGQPCSMPYRSADCSHSTWNGRPIRAKGAGVGVGGGSDFLKRPATSPSLPWDSGCRTQYLLQSGTRSTVLGLQTRMFILFLKKEFTTAGCRKRSAGRTLGPLPKAFPSVRGPASWTDARNWHLSRAPSLCSASSHVPVATHGSLTPWTHLPLLPLS